MQLSVMGKSMGIKPESLNMLDKELLDIFGQKLISRVRDQSIFEFEGMVQGKIKSANMVKLNNELKIFDKHQIEILKKVVLTAIDSVILILAKKVDKSCLYDINKNHRRQISWSKNSVSNLNNNQWIMRYLMYTFLSANLPTI